MSTTAKARLTYAIASVDHALRMAAMLQMQGGLTVAEAAERLGVAPSTAHRLLQMLVYRDFAVRDELSRGYLVGPVLQATVSSPSLVTRLRAAALPELERVTQVLNESANLIVRTGATARFVASTESDRALRVSSREGMAFPAHRTSGGLVLLAELSEDERATVYDTEPVEVRPDASTLQRDLIRVRRAGFAVNRGRAEAGIVAVGVPIRDADGVAVAALCVSMPSVRYDRKRLGAIVSVLQMRARACSAALVESC